MLGSGRHPMHDSSPIRSFGSHFHVPLSSLYSYTIIPAKRSENDHTCRSGGTTGCRERSARTARHVSPRRAAVFTASVVHSSCQITGKGRSSIPSPSQPALRVAVRIPSQPRSGPAEGVDPVFLSARHLQSALTMRSVHKTRPRCVTSRVHDPRTRCVQKGHLYRKLELQAQPNPSRNRKTFHARPHVSSRPCVALPCIIYYTLT